MGVTQTNPDEPRGSTNRFHPVALQILEVLSLGSHNMLQPQHLPEMNRICSVEAVKLQRKWN